MNELLLLSASEVAGILASENEELSRVVREAYISHSLKETNVPAAGFLNIGGVTGERGIALSAALKRGSVIGMKWITSFPFNYKVGLPRASGIIILNCADTGRPKAILEGALISAERTAISASVAASALRPKTPRKYQTLGVCGCGIISSAITRRLLATQPSIERVIIYDTDVQAASRFQGVFEKDRRTSIKVASSSNMLFEESDIISIATTAQVPYIDDTYDFSKVSTILHISLRDFIPKTIARLDNVVDDVAHCLSARTSLHMASEELIGQSIIRTTIGDILLGRADGHALDYSPTVFSPFGLGILDVAVANHVYESAILSGVGRRILDFLS